MRPIHLAIATLISLQLSCTADAQERRPNNRHGSSGASSASGSDRPLPSDPIRRTWDFTKRYGIIQLGGRGGCGEENRQAQAQLASADRLLAEFLAGPMDPKKLGFERLKYLGQLFAAERAIPTYLSNFQAIGKRGADGYVPSAEQDICTAKGQRISVLAIRDGLRGIARVYPDMREVAPVLHSAEAALRSMGDDADIAATVNTNRNGSLDAVRMKPALSSNPAWISGFRSGFAQLIPDEAVLKIHLYSANWYVHKSEVTDKPEYRQIGAWIAARRPDGTCWIHSVDLWQNYTGTGFDSGEYKEGGPRRQILCKNV